MRKIKIFFVVIIIFLLLPYSLNWNFLKAETFINNSVISTDTTWTVENSPYVLWGNNLFISSGASLTIEPGVIIKLYSKSIYVSGELNAIGDENNPIVFTSLNDDSHGGQTIWWSTGMPERGDWGTIETRSSGKITMDHVIVSYGGQEKISLTQGNKIITPKYAFAVEYDTGAVTAQGGDIQITNSIFTQNKIGLESNSHNNFSINYSDIFGNARGIINNTWTPLDATNNWWGDDSGPYYDGAFPMGYGDSIEGNIIFDPWVGMDMNQAPEIIFLEQYKADGETDLDEGSTTLSDIIVFKALISDPEGDQYKLEVDLREYNEPFFGDNLNLLESELFNSGEVATTVAKELPSDNYHWRARAVDEHGKAGVWQEFGIGDSWDFQVSAVPLYTQRESKYPSTEETRQWFDQEYAKGYTQNYYCGSTIEGCGCGITSAVMVMRYYDLYNNVEDNDINPQTLNTWLYNATSTIIGYYNGNINWKAINEYARDPDTNQLRFVFRGRMDGTSSNKEVRKTLDKDLELGEPVIVRHNGIGHFFVATEKLASTYSIRDPYWYETNLLDQTKSSDKVYDYNNHYDGIRRFYKIGFDDPRPLAYANLEITIGSPAEILVIDPNGSSLGTDPIRGAQYNEIDGGTYTTEGISNPEYENPPEHKTKTISIPNPEHGNYIIKVIGTGHGNYTLYNSATDNNGQTKYEKLLGTTEDGLITQYDLYFDPNDSETSHMGLSDLVPPEVRIYFNRLNPGITIEGIDNISEEPDVVQETECLNRECNHKTVTYTITDEADNSLNIILRVYTAHDKITVHLDSLQYNNEEKINKNIVIKYFWNIPKDNNEIHNLKQEIHDDFGQRVMAMYNSEKDNSSIFTLNPGSRNQKKIIENGMVIIDIITINGSVEYYY